MKNINKFNINDLRSLGYKEFSENRIDNEVMNVKEAATLLGVSTKLVYEKASDGIIPNKRLGNRYLFLRSELIKFIKGD